MGLHVFFGGSFSPPHIGHHQLLHRLLSEPGVEKVHLVPTGINPLKDSASGAYSNFSAGDRKLFIDAWLLALKAEGWDLAHKLSLELFELESQSPSYTVDSLAVLKAANPTASWALAIGADNLPQLPRWKSIGELLSGLSAVWVFQRGGYELSPREIPTELRGICAWRLFPEPLEWISSTELRDLIVSPDATQAKLRSYLLDNVFEVLVRLLQTKNHE